MMLQKIKAGALQLTMFIVIVIALLLLIFIILINTHKRFKIQTDFVLETIENANKGVDYLLQNELRFNDTIRVNLQDEDYKILNVHRDYWGIFEKVISTSKIKKNTFKKIALLGAIQPINDRTALYLEEQNRPLVVVGNTKIQGLVYLPKQGIRIGNISGHSYYGSQLIDGLTKTTCGLPEILKQTLEQIKTIENNSDAINSNQFLDLIKTRTHQNSFFNPMQVVYNFSAINLSGVSLTGHILVQSETEIIVESSSNLKDVILVAPTIEIMDQVKGTFQAIASKEIKIGKHCVLGYPSAIVLKDDTKKLVASSFQNDEDVQISIDDNSIVKGVVVFIGEVELNNFKAQIVVEEQSIVEGEVYCNRNLELKGSVYGSVFTSSFVAKQSGSVYQNHIYNGRILIDELPLEYVGLTFENSKKGVIKWLY